MGKAGKAGSELSQRTAAVIAAGSIHSRTSGSGVAIAGVGYPLDLLEGRAVDEPLGRQRAGAVIAAALRVSFQTLAVVM